MNFLVSHDIPLSYSTIEAWKSQGGIVLKRHRDRGFIETYLSHHPEVEFILNLGSAINEDNTDMGTPVINPNRVVRAFWFPSTTRLALGELLPPQPEVGNTDWWSKDTGRGGRNKLRHNGPYDPEFIHSEDVQVHIEGQEYRVLTVGGRIIQQFERHGSNGNRSYRWLNRELLPNTITDIVARATRDIGTYTLIAWDTINAEDRAFILEGNCCPGVKEPTAARVVNAVRRLINAS